MQRPVLFPLRIGTCVDADLKDRIRRAARIERKTPAAFIREAAAAAADRTIAKSQRSSGANGES